MPLEEGLKEAGGQVNIVPIVGQVKICLEGRRIPLVEEAVDFGRRRGRNGGSIGSNDAICRWWKKVNSLGLLFLVVRVGDDRAERFRSV